MGRYFKVVRIMKSLCRFLWTHDREDSAFSTFWVLARFFTSKCKHAGDAYTVCPALHSRIVQRKQPADLIAPEQGKAALTSQGQWMRQVSLYVRQIDAQRREAGLQEPLAKQCPYVVWQGVFSASPFPTNVVGVFHKLRKQVSEYYTNLLALNMLD